MSSINSIDFHDQAGFFLNFARNTVGQRLAQLEHPARQRPLPFRRLVATLHQQNAAPVDHDRPDADDRRLGKFTL